MQDDRHILGQSDNTGNKIFSPHTSINQVSHDEFVQNSSLP